MHLFDERQTFFVCFGIIHAQAFFVALEVLLYRGFFHTHQDVGGNFEKRGDLGDGLDVGVGKTRFPAADRLERYAEHFGKLFLREVPALAETF